MANDRVLNRILLIACALMASAGAGLLALAVDGRAAAEAGDSNVAAAVPGAASPSPEHESRFDPAVERVAPSSVLRVRVVCEHDGNAIAGASVRQLLSGQAVEEHRAQVTSVDGVAELPVIGSGEVALEVVARGYSAWRGTQALAADECRVELRGQGVVEFECPQSDAFTSLASISLRQSSSHGEARLAKARPYGDLLRVDGLRPGAHYDISIEDTTAELIAERTQVQAGWPEPSRVTILVRARVAHDVLLAGIAAEDCASLRVCLASAGRDGPWTSVSWDPARNLGVSTPAPFGAGDAVELLVRGPLGQVLHRSRWSSREEGPLELELERTDVVLVLHGERPGRDEWIQWDHDGAFGYDPPPSGATLRLLCSKSASPALVDLRWGALQASGVELPRRAAIEFHRPPTGELRITEIEEGVVSLLSRPGNQQQELEPVDDQLWATVDAGAYQLQIDGVSVGAPVVVAPNDVRWVSLAQLRQRASLRVLLPSPVEATAVGTIQVGVTQIGSGNRKLRQIGVAAASSEVSFVDLPPGEVYVEARSDALGYMRERALLTSGRESTLELPAWDAPRGLTVRLEDDAGRSLTRETFQLAVIGQGPGATIHGTTDSNGEALLTLAGGGSALVGSKRGFGVYELASDQTFLLVRFGAGDDRLSVRAEGWWRDKARSMAVLRERGGVTEFVPGRATDEEGRFEVPRGDRFVVVVMLRDRSRVFVTPVDGSDEMVLDTPPRTTRLRVARPDAELAPESVVVRLESVGGVDVRGTSFARAFGQSHSFGQDLELMQAAPFEVVVEAAPAHGGIVWRSERVRLEPGAESNPIQLEVIR